MSKGWDNATLKKLKALMGKGLSTSEIGKKLGMSKNAVVGKLNRLGWNLKAGVIAVDVGTNQLIDELKNDSRVISLEQTDIRILKPFEPVDLIVIDVSFISLTNIMDALVKWNAPQIIALIKPQFEVSRSVAARSGGVIKNEIERENAVKNVIQDFKKNGYNQQGIIESPIKGGSGNTEYLAYLRHAAQ